MPIELHLSHRKNPLHMLHAELKLGCPFIRKIRIRRKANFIWRFVKIQIFPFRTLCQKLLPIGPQLYRRKSLFDGGSLKKPFHLFRRKTLFVSYENPSLIKSLSQAALISLINYSGESPFFAYFGHTFLTVNGWGYWTRIRNFLLAAKKKTSKSFSAYYLYLPLRGGGSNLCLKNVSQGGGGCYFARGVANLRKNPLKTFRDPLARGKMYPCSASVQNQQSLFLVVNLARWPRSFGAGARAKRHYPRIPFWLFSPSLCRVLRFIFVALFGF